MKYYSVLELSVVFYQIRSRPVQHGSLPTPCPSLQLPQNAKNIPSINSAVATFHVAQLWSKEIAPSNIHDVSIANNTSQLEMSKLNEVAFQNTSNVFVTDDAFQFKTSALNDVTFTNTSCMLEMDETSHIKMSPLKLVASLNNPSMNSTLVALHIARHWSKHVGRVICIGHFPNGHVTIH